MPVPDSGSPRTFGDQPYSPLSDPAFLAQTAMRKLREQSDALEREAAAFATGRQAAAEEASQAFQQQAGAPLPGLPPMASVPYMANAFAAGFAGRPDVAQQGERAVAMSRDELRRRRQEVLQSMHEKFLIAAKQADEAGDLQKSLQFTNKANLALKEYETAAGMAETREKRQADQDTLRQRQKFESGEAAADRSFRTKQNAQEQAFRIWLASQDNPSKRAEIEAAQQVFAAKTKPLEARLSMVGAGDNIARDKAAAAAAIDTAAAGYIAKVEEIERKYATPPPGQAAPGAPTVTTTPPPGPPPLGAAPPPPPQEPKAKVTVEGVVGGLAAEGVTDASSLRSWLKAKGPTGKNRMTVLKEDGVDITKLFEAVYEGGATEELPTVSVGKTDVELTNAQKQARKRVADRKSQAVGKGSGRLILNPYPQQPGAGNPSDIRRPGLFE